MKNFNLTATYTDLYQLTMGQVYFLKGQHRQHAVFDYFFRKLPFQGGYVVFAGLHNLMEILEGLKFSSEDLEYLHTLGLHSDYLKHLKDFRFEGTLYSVQEGDVIFPTHPVVRVEGTILEVQLIETLLLNILNFESLVATKAARIRQAAGKDKVLSDFGLRRAQGLGGYNASRAAQIGGFNATSNVAAARDFNIPVGGTMAHAFIQGYDNELGAFRSIAEGRPKNCVLLVDTYDTLRSGIPNAIIVAKEMEKRGQRLKGVRLDSGDLAYLAKRSRQLLDDADLHYVTITASNQLDEYVIKSLLEQGAPIDVFGVGTSLVTGHPDGALDGVYKLSMMGNTPRIKLSETIQKTTLPHEKQVYRVYDPSGNFLGADVVTLKTETPVEVMHHPYEPEKLLNIAKLRQEPLLHKVMDQGKVVGPSPSLTDLAAYAQQRLSLLPQEYKRFQNPHLYKIGISEKLKALRDDMRKSFKSL